MDWSRPISHRTAGAIHGVDPLQVRDIEIANRAPRADHCVVQHNPRKLDAETAAGVKWVASGKEIIARGIGFDERKMT